MGCRCFSDFLVFDDFDDSEERRSGVWEVSDDFSHNETGTQPLTFDSDGEFLQSRYKRTRDIHVSPAVIGQNSTRGLFLLHVSVSFQKAKDTPVL